MKNKTKSCKDNPFSVSLSFIDNVGITFPSLFNFFFSFLFFHLMAYHWKIFFSSFIYSFIKKFTLYFLPKMMLFNHHFRHKIFMEFNQNTLKIRVKKKFEDKKGKNWKKSNQQFYSIFLQSSFSTSRKLLHQLNCLRLKQKIKTKHLSWFWI